jgi:penicillin-binding protein 1A
MAGGRRRSAHMNSSKRFRETKKYLPYVIAFVGILLIAYTVILLSGLPSLEQLENPKPDLASRVMSLDGEVLDQFYVKNRTRVTRNQLPKTLIEALTATEDKDFYHHWGVDLGRFAKAMVKNLISLRLREGASTITQQLARNLYELKGARESIFEKVTRKIREAITAVQIERTYTKDEILEMYFNISYFGRSAYGIATAAQVYFDKAPKDLDLKECALLVAMLRGPAHYDPFNHPTRAAARAELVLKQMLKENFITEQQYEAATAEHLRLASLQGPTGIAPHFVEYIRQKLSRDPKLRGRDLYRDGLTIYTTLDSRMQRHANEAVEEHLAIYQEKFKTQWNWSQYQDILDRAIDKAIYSTAAYQDAPTPRDQERVYSELRNEKSFVDSVRKAEETIEVGFVAIDARSGEIRAMVGGSNFRTFKYGLNHVTQILRQPGSAFKPFVYTVAIDNGYPPSFELLNQPVTIMMADGKRWTPRNAEGEFGGKITLREGLKYSVNLISVRLVTQEISPVKQVIQYAHRMGIKSVLPPYESLAMGVGEVSPLDMTAAFAVYANEGVYVEPISILRIEDKDGNILEENFPVRKEVLSKETAFIMTTMMQGVVNGGTGIHVRDYFHLPAAGKTGTTQEFADAWFVGYTPQLSAGVWVGFDDKQVHFTNWDGQGGRAAAPIWGRFMKYVYEDPEIGMPLEYFEKPDGVIADSVCTETKKLATEFCPSKELEYFTSKSLPPKCDVHTSPFWKKRKENPSTISF